MNPTCNKCHGTGTVPSHRSRWIGGSKHGYRSEWTVNERCARCDGTGTVDDLDPIWQRTAAASLIDSDRANAD